jgi:type II secretory pathway pseudopilin PulG
MSLVELLIVVTILLFAAAVFVPRLKPMMDHSKIREAARVIQLYLSTARNQAMSTGRSCGVMILPLPSDTGCSMTLSRVETPPPYGGTSQGAYARINLDPKQPYIGNQANCDVALFTSQGKPDPLIVQLHQGDLIQIGYQGYWLLVANPVPVGAATFNARLDISHGESPAWMRQPSVSGAPPVYISGPYKIIRVPTKSDAAPLQLPGGTCIDLNWCGFDPIVSGQQPTWQVQSPAPTPPALPTPIIVSFAADGRVDWISTSQYPAGQPAISPVYFLVGTRKKVVDLPTTDPNTNLNDFNSLWVSIDAATGLILITDPAAVGTDASVLMPSTNPSQPDSRYFARQALANGGGK